MNEVLDLTRELEIKLREKQMRKETWELAVKVYHELNHLNTRYKTGRWKHLLRKKHP